MLLLVATLLALTGAPQIPRDVARAVALPEAAQGDREVTTVCRDQQGRWAGGDVWLPVAGVAMAFAPRGARCRALVRPRGMPSYLATAETAWEPSPRPLALTREAYRMVLVSGAVDSPQWVGDPATHAECDGQRSRTRCLFVGAAESGVVVGEGRDVRFALSRARADGQGTVWQSAPWGRFIRVTTPAQGGFSARVVAVEPALRHGSGLLLEARASGDAKVHLLDAKSLWLEGRGMSAARLELRAPRAAVTELPLRGLRTSAAAPLDVFLAPDETVEGDVRSSGRLLEGATVVLARIAGEGTPPSTPDEERPMELMGEARTDAAGGFAFSGLAAGKYELVVMHPTRGRARAIVRAPSRTRVVLVPRVTRGRVLRDGVPVENASVAVLPSFEALTAARNPMMLLSETVLTGADGRFETLLPDEGPISLTVVHGELSARMALGDAAALPEVVALGDVPLDPPIEREILLALPPTCLVQAAGPIGEPGMSMTRVAPIAEGRWRLRAALPGRWLVEAACSGKDVPLEPTIIVINRADRAPIVLRR